MKTVINFIVGKRLFLLAAFAALSLVCAVLYTKVEINTDMTKYLPDSSSMKQGIDLMASEFPAVEDNYTVRVMFTGLTDAQKSDIKKELEAIEYVKSVDYAPGDADYNRDNHTLYVVNTAFAYGTQEEESVEAAIAKQFSAYEMSFINDNSLSEDIPLLIIVIALIIVFAVLFVMCSSWIEPVLFLITIGIAVLLNMGTNIFMGSVSSITASISAILQLVLSMDYSVMLINRYRQELQVCDSPADAMKAALKNSFSSILGSATTTFVGLIVLVFMSFKIGADMGIVLAKGVALSMLCVFTVLPGLILLCEKIIKKTAKKSLRIKMDKIGSFSFKFRYLITGVFAVLFAVVFFMHGSTRYDFTLERKDDIAQVFTPVNPVVIVYSNDIDDAMTQTAFKIEDNPGVKSVNGYSVTLDRGYTAQELADVIDEMGADIDFDPSLLKVVYYDYHKKGVTGTMTAGRFIDFVTEDIMKNDVFSDLISDDMSGNIEQLKKFADKDALDAQMDAEGLAEFFGMDGDDVMLLFLLYQTEHSTSADKLTLPEFANFVIDEVVFDPNYSDMLDDDVIEQVSLLGLFTNEDAFSAEMSYKELARLLGMDEETAKLLLVYNYAQSDSYEPPKIKLPAFIDFVTGIALNDQMLSGQFDANAVAQIMILRFYTDKDKIRTEMTPAELSAAIGLDAEMAGGIVQMATGSPDGKMSPFDFVGFLLNNVVPDPNFSASFSREQIDRLTLLHEIMSAAVSDTALGYAQVADMTGMPARDIRLMYTYYDSVNGKTSAWSMSQRALINLIVDNGSQLGMDQGVIAQLAAAQKMMNATVAGTAYTAKELASFLGMDASQLNGVFMLHKSLHGDTSEWKMSVRGFVDFVIDDVLTNAAYASKLDAGAGDGLKAAKALIDAVVSDKTYTSRELADVLSAFSGDMDAKSVDVMYLYYFADRESEPGWTLSIVRLFGYLSGTLVDDRRFETFIDDKLRADIDGMKAELDDAAAQLRSGNFSRLVIETTFPAESAETTAFFDELTAMCDEAGGEYHIIGTSAMTYEMQHSFGGEMRFITILTAIAIFLIILVSFRSLSIPLILVAVIQCGVYLTVSLIGIGGGSMYYLALLIVQCILMGATIDYGILFTNYYVEKRKTLDRKEALKESYNGSIHTILTSGSIIILVTGILGYFFNNPTISQICRTIAQGTLCATVLIIFLLPGILASLDRIVIKKKGDNADPLNTQ